MLIGISLLVTLIGFNLSEPGLGVPSPHCDRKGYPSCFDAGFQDGQANPGTACPSGHSKKFCNGWNAGASTGSNSKIQNTQQNSPPSSSNATPNQSNVSVFIVLFLLIVGSIAFKLRKRGKSKERKGFPQHVKENNLRKQNHKCANCKRLLNVVDWDHKNGNRSENRENNCQALCPNRHAIKTHRAQSKR